jgi:hypothetical protein
MASWYTNANCTIDEDTYHSTLSNCFILPSGVISWCYKK